MFIEQALENFREYLNGKSYYTRFVYQMSDEKPRIKLLLFVIPEYPGIVFGVENDKKYPSVGVLFTDYSSHDSVNFATFDLCAVFDDTYDKIIERCISEAQSDDIRFRDEQEAIRQYVRQNGYLLNKHIREYAI